MMTEEQKPSARIRELWLAGDKRRHFAIIAYLDEQHEAALRRQAEVKQPGEEPAMAIAREGIRRVAKERDEALANYRVAVSATERVIAERDEAVAALEDTKKVLAATRRVLTEETSKEQRAHEATRKELDAAQRQRAEDERLILDADAKFTEYDGELAALRKPLEGELAGDVAELREFFRYGSSDWRDKLLPALSRLEAALQAKGEPRCPGCSRPFTSPDHDARCSACAESGTGPEPQPPADADTSQASYKPSDYEQLGPVCSPDEAAARIAWGKAERAKMMKPPAETPEPRAIVVDSVWSAGAYRVCVTGLAPDYVHYKIQSGDLIGQGTYSRASFLSSHTHISDPEPAAPAAPAPLPEPSK